MREEIGLTLLAFSIGGLWGREMVEGCTRLVRVGYFNMSKARNIKLKVKRQKGKVINFPRNGR